MRHDRILNLFISSILPTSSSLIKIQRKSITTCLGCGKFQSTSRFNVNSCLPRIVTASIQKRHQSNHQTSTAATNEHTSSNKIPSPTQPHQKKYANINVKSRPAEPSIAINKLSTQGRPSEALSIYLKLLAEGGFPSREALYQLVRALYKSNNLVGMYAVHDTLYSHYTITTKPSKRSARAMIYMYTMLIDLITKTTRPVDMTTVTRLCKEMTQLTDKNAANIVLYNTLIKTLLDQGQLSHAKELLNDLKRNNLQPTIITFGIFIKDASRRKDVPSMLDYLDEMEQITIQPDFAIVSILVTTLCDMQEFDRAKDMVEKLYNIKTDELLVGAKFRHQLLKSIEYKRKKFNRNSINKSL
jgi:pentatricopeptide repeat protein